MIAFDPKNLLNLTYQQRQILELRYQRRASIEEIAHWLGIANHVAVHRLESAHARLGIVPPRRRRWCRRKIVASQCKRGSLNLDWL